MNLLLTLVEDIMHPVDQNKVKIHLFRNFLRHKKTTRDCFLVVQRKFRNDLRTIHQHARTLDTEISINYDKPFLYLILREISSYLGEFCCADISYMIATKIKAQ